jgi:hypothetical protein
LDLSKDQHALHNNFLALLPLKRLAKMRLNILKALLTVLLLRALMHEFARVSQAIIHGAVQSKKSDPSIK